MEANIEYLVKDGKFFRRTFHEDELGPLTDIVKKARSAGYTIIPDAFTIEHPSKLDYENNTYKDAISIPVHLGRSGTTLHVAHRLIFYPLWATFREQPENGTLRFLGDNTGGKKTRAACDYPGLWMIYSFRLSNHRINGFQHMYMTTNIKGKHFAPHLPNVHDNGQICLGDIRAKFKGDISSCVQNLFNDFFTAESNNHLLHDQGFDALVFQKKEKEGVKEVKWAPPNTFYENPITYHNGRETSIAAEFLTSLTKLEETDNSVKVGK